jgi:type I restriction enzyme S subunit
MSEWKETTLGEISLDVAYGYTERASFKNIGPKFLRITDIQDDFINWDNVPYCPISKKNYSKYKLDIGDIVIARTGNSTGATATIKKQVEAVFASYLIRFKLDSTKADYNFIDFVLRSYKWKSFVNTVKGGSAQAGANAKQFSEFPILLPPLSEQKAIAAVLSCLDDKIELLRQQNQTLEKIAQTLFKHWFVDFEFPNEDGKPYKSSGGKMVDSELGEIPDGWRVGRLGDEFKIIMGQSPAGSSYNERGEGTIFFQGRTDFGFRFPEIRLYTTEPKKIAEKFDVLLSVRAPVGNINMSPEKCCIGRGLAAIKSDYKSYAYYKMKHYKPYFNVFESEGTVFGALTKEGFDSLQSLIPTDSVVAKFETVINPIDNKIFNNNQQIQTLSRLRDTILPKLMKGEVRVQV